MVTKARVPQLDTTDRTDQTAPNRFPQNLPLRELA